MTAPTLVHREMGDKLHILNYTLGEIMSFERDDGRYLLDNLDLIAGDNDIVDEATRRLLTTRGSSVCSRSFRSPLVNLGMQFRFPTVANFEINRRCVLRCQHCYIPTADLASKADSDFEAQTENQTATLFDSVRDLGVILVVLTGGEVFINRRLQPLLEQLRERHFVVEVFSSLQFLPDWFLSLDPVEWRIGRIQTSVYSITPPIHDEVTGAVGSMKRTLENLEVLRDKGFYVEAATPLMKSNFDSRHEIERYFVDRGIKQSFAWPIVSEYYNGNENKAVLNVSKEQFAQFCRERPDYLIKLNTENGADRPICPAGRAVLSISANGDVFSCSQFPKAVGNIKQADVGSIYRSPEMRKIADYKMGDIAADALPYNYCMGNNFSETGDPLKQPPVVYEHLKHFEDTVVSSSQELK